MVFLAAVIGLVTGAVVVWAIVARPVAGRPDESEYETH